jgi:hypothetical protein
VQLFLHKARRHGGNIFKLANESLGIHDKLKLDNHSEADQNRNRPLDLEDKALKFLNLQAT